MARFPSPVQPEFLPGGYTRLVRIETCRSNSGDLKIRSSANAMSCVASCLPLGSLAPFSITDNLIDTQTD